MLYGIVARIGKGWCNLKSKASCFSKKSLIFFTTLGIAILVAGFIWYSASNSSIPDGVPENIYDFLVSYLETRENDPDNSVDYCHFEYEMEEQAYINSFLEIQGYEVIHVDTLADGFYAFKVHLEREADLSTDVYLFVGPVNGQLSLMNNVYNVPEEIRLQIDEDAFYEYTYAGTLLSPSTLLAGLN